MTELVFVYNADSSVLAGLKDIIHKIRSPDTYECGLCKLTHGIFSPKTVWKDFLDSGTYDILVYHRDEFKVQFPRNTSELPAVFIKRSNGLTRIVSPEDFKEGIPNIKSLLEVVQIRVSQFLADRTPSAYE